MLAKVAVLEIDGLDAGLRYDEVRSVFETQSNFSPRSNVGKRITEALAFADRGFTDEEAALLRNRTMVQSLLTLVCRVVEGGQASGAEKAIAAFFKGFQAELNRQVELGQNATDSHYLAFQRTVNANVRSGSRLRNTILLRKLLAFDPGFADLFDPAAISATGLNASVKEDGEAIAALVAKKNEQYASKHGVDLFKATNKTAQAQLRIGTPIKNFEAYKTLIEDLYFLFHEGVGQRLSPDTPQSFADINILRTDMQHDLDHGKSGKVRSKRKKTGEIFARYGGSSSPVVLEPERFVLVQANLLAAVKAALGNLNF